jgi:hypothetical protein
MLDKLTIDMFAAHLGEKFRLRVQPEQVVEVELVEVTPLRARSADGREAPPGRAPFSVVFRGPTSAVAQQRIYALEHDSMGTHELFIVPVGPGQGGMLYEAIFS